MKKIFSNKYLLLMVGMVFVVVPFIIALLVSTPNPIIKDLDTNNAWIGFWASYSGSIATLVVLYVTTQQTRWIQEENLDNSIRPAVDIEVTRGLFIYYDIDNKNNFKISKASIDGEGSNEACDLTDRFKKDIIKIINLSTNNYAKNIKYTIEVNPQDIIKKLRSLGKEVRILKSNTPGIMRIYTNQKNKFLHINENKNLYLNGQERFLKPNQELDINGDSLFIFLIDFINDILKIYREQAITQGSLDIGSAMINKELFTMDIVLKYADGHSDKDRKSREYTRNYKLFFMLHSISQDKVFVITTNLVDY